MAEKILEVEMVTPEKISFREPADFVVIPAFQGELGVLPDHAPSLVQLKVGEVRVTKGGQVHHFAISGGFAEIKKNKVSLFAETAEMADEIDAERARQAFERAKAETLKPGLDPLTMAGAEAAMRRAQIRLQVASKRSR